MNSMQDIRGRLKAGDPGAIIAADEWNKAKFSAFVYADIFDAKKIRQEITPT